MIYLIFALVAAVAAGAAYLYCHYEGVAEAPWTLPKRQPLEEGVTPFSKKAAALLFGGAAVVFFLALLSLDRNADLVALIKLFALLVLVTCAGVIDIKRKIIPNRLILAGAVFWVLITVYDVLGGGDLKSLFISEGIGFAIGFVLLALVSFVTKGAMGFGDVKLFGLIGLISGAYGTYSTLLVSLVVSVVVSVIGMALKRIGRKDSIPFGPCIALGYAIVLFFGSY